MNTISTIDHLNEKLKQLNHLNPEEIAKEEGFWQEMRKAYQINPDFVNLENGYYGMMPEVTLEAQIKHTRDLNRLNTFYMRNDKDTELMNLKVILAGMIDCEAENIAFVRNGTEALNLLIAGIELKKGDEILASKQGYPTGLEAIEQRIKKEGIVKKLIDLPLHPQNPEEIVQCFENAITANTKLIVVTHLIHWTGQILPVKEITEMAHKKGVEVMVDSAHAFAHIAFSWKDIDCDYWLTNLHKWLAGPLTAAVVVIKKEKIGKVTPLLASVNLPVDDIRKLENTSATPMPIFMTIFDAIRFHEITGIKIKQARLNYLKNYWINQVVNLPNVQINTPLAASCAIANFSIIGRNSTEVAKELFEKHKIYSVGFELDFINGLRITPHLYTSLEDLDKLVRAIQTL